MFADIAVFVPLREEGAGHPTPADAITTSHWIWREGAFRRVLAVRPIRGGVSFQLAGIDRRRWFRNTEGFPEERATVGMIRSAHARRPGGPESDNPTPESLVLVDVIAALRGRKAS